MASRSSRVSRVSMTGPLARWLTRIQWRCWVWRCAADDSQARSTQVGPLPARRHPRCLPRSELIMPTSRPQKPLRAAPS